MSLGDRIAAWSQWIGSRGQPNLNDPFTRERRLPLMQQAAGDVLEIGAGDGTNLSLYPPGVRLTLLEPNPFRIRYLREQCAKLSANCAEIKEGVGEDLPFPDASFDTVLTLHVLCSVNNQPDVLAEVRRVLRPGGRFLFLEHVAAPPETRTARVQKTINPVWNAVSGCNFTRDTGATIRAAGFSDVEITAFNVENWPKLVSPHVMGVARV